MRVLPGTLLAAAAATVLAACGGGATAPSNRRLPDVRLQVTGPADGQVVHADAVQVSGRVSPARAIVRVLGREAPTTAEGRFTLSVPIREGANVLDVSAAARGRAPALTAVRVTRDTRVAVPQLAGEDPDAAMARLEALGFSVTQQRDGGFFDHLIPGTVQACRTVPAAGAKLPRGSDVVLHVAKHC